MKVYDTQAERQRGADRIAQLLDLWVRGNAPTSEVSWAIMKILCAIHRKETHRD